jgi:hypothetical protein
MTGAATPQATVKSESLPVYSRMNATSDVVKTLKKGDAVVIEMSILGESNIEWCSIQEPTQKTSLGFVRCEFLARPPAPMASFAPIEAAKAQAATQPAATDWSKSPLAAKIRKLCPEIDEGQLNYGWPLPQVASHIAMERCFAISERASGEKKMTADEIRTWQSKAKQSGAQACWDRYLAIRAKHRALELDEGAAARSRDALREWERDPCYRRVDAFFDAVALSPYMKYLPRMYDDIMSGRQPQVPLP